MSLQKNVPQHFQICQETPIEVVLVWRIVALEEEINRDVDVLVDLKMEVIGVIRFVEKKEYGVLLELRYLCFKSWEDIAAEMHYSVRWVHISFLEHWQQWIRF